MLSASSLSRPLHAGGTLGLFVVDIHLLLHVRISFWSLGILARKRIELNLSALLAHSHRLGALFEEIDGPSSFS